MSRVVVEMVRTKQTARESTDIQKHLLMLTYTFTLFSLPVYMFSFRLLLLYIIVHLIFKNLF